MREKSVWESHKMGMQTAGMPWEWKMLSMAIPQDERLMLGMMCQKGSMVEDSRNASTNIAAKLGVPSTVLFIS